MVENPYKSPEANERGTPTQGAEAASKRLEWWQWIAVLLFGTAIGIAIRTVTGIKWGGVTLGVLAVLAALKLFESLSSDTRA